MVQWVQEFIYVPEFFIALWPHHSRENSYVTFGLMVVSASTNFTLGI